MHKLLLYQFERRAPGYEGAPASGVPYTQTLWRTKSYTKVLAVVTARAGTRMGDLRSPDQVSDITTESPGLWGSYLTEAGKPRRQEYKSMNCRRWVTSCDAS